MTNELNIQEIGTVEITIDGYTHTDWPKYGLFDGAKLVGTSLSRNAMTWIVKRGYIQPTDRHSHNEITWAA